MTTRGAEVIYEGQSYQTVTEGAASILNTISAKQTSENKKQRGNGSNDEPQTVFYNPIQQFNRDLSVLAIRVFSEDLVTVRQQTHGKRRWPAPKNKTKRKRDEDENELVSLEEQPLSKIPKHDQASETALVDDGSEKVAERGAPAEVAGFTNGQISTHNGPHLGNGTEKIIGKESRNINDFSVHAENVQAPDAKTIPSGPKISEPQIDSASRIRVLDALSATGLRALRYAKEIPQVTSVTANDLSLKATKAIALNVHYNKLESKIDIATGDATDQMQRRRGQYEVIDLDPYGTAAPFIDAAVQGLSNGGLLCITCTDAGVFASTGYLEKTFSQYGGISAKGPYAHEAGLRLILHAVATSAARYGLAIEPLLSLSIDFYARLFVKIRRSPQEVKFLGGKTMIVYSCESGCGAWSKQLMVRTKYKEDKKGNPLPLFSLAQAPTASPNCEHCGFKTHVAGPMWGGPIQNPYFIQRMLDVLSTLSTDTYGTIPRMEGMLTTAREETLLPKETPSSGSASTNDGPSFDLPYPIPRIPPNEPDHHPFFFLLSSLSRVLHCSSPSDNAMRGALLGLGHRVTRTHAKPGSIRTDAPWSVIWEIMREWVRQKKPVKEGAIAPGTAGWGIMQKDRSKSKLNGFKNELSQIVRNAREESDMKKQLEALLWRLDKGAVEETTESAMSNEKADRSELRNQDKSSEEENPSEKEAKNSKPDLSELEVEFDERRGAASEVKKRMVRYQLNPRANWGPMSRAKG